VISWSLWYLSGVLSRGSDFIYDYKWLISQIGVFAPSLSALIISGFQSRELRKNGLKILSLFILMFIGGVLITRYAPRSIQDFTPGISILVVMLGVLSLIFFSLLNRKFLIPATGQIQGKAGFKLILIAVLGIPFLFLLGWFLVNLQGNSWSVSSLKNGPTGFFTTLVTAFLMNLIFGGSLGEELGWRGFALPILLKKYSPIQASFVLGLIWALWHLPIYLYDMNLFSIGKFLFFLVWTIPLTIIFTWFYLNSGGNILVAILLHTAVNVLPDLGFSRYENSMIVLTIFLIFAAIIASRSQCMMSPETQKDNQ
jgi:membrane protease YdiL (CAAX protease family)